MDTLARIYPPLSQRRSISILYQPVTFALTLFPFLTFHRRRTSVYVFPILLALTILAPCYTFGDASADYYSTSFFIAAPIWFLEFAIFRPQYGSGAPVYTRPGADHTVKPRRWEDATSMVERAWWAASLMIPAHRGIGWDWQIRQVPSDPNHRLPKWSFVQLQLGYAILAYLRSAVILVLLGCGTGLEKEAMGSPFGTFAVGALLGWSGAIWVWDRLCCFYSLLAAVSVAIGLCERAQWPPLMDRLRKAWSVRQMWSVVYHQTMRQLVSQPALRIARALGLRKGSLASRYTQLYISFGISCLVHQYQMFNVTRRGMGEFIFFMSQPIAISVEDLVQWVWRLYIKKTPTDRRWGTLFSTSVGYCWVFLWFSFSLPIYVKGCRDAGIVRDAIFGNRLFDFGVWAASQVMQQG